MKSIEQSDQTGLTSSNSGKTGMFPLSAEDFFDSMLNETCSRLEDRRNRGILKRIYRMETILETLECELDALLKNPARNGVP